MRVLVTRPQPGADDLAQALRVAGFTPILCPALVIEPCAAPKCWPIARDGAGADEGVTADTATTADEHATAGHAATHNDGATAGAMARRVSSAVSAADIFIFISPNAVRLGWRFCHSRASDRACGWYAVGPTTAELLTARGVQATAPAPPGSSDALLGLAPLRDVKGKRVVIVRGVGGLATLGETLAARGAQVDALEVYERKALPAQQLAVALAQAPEAIVVSSGDGLDAVLAAAATCALTDGLRRIPVVVPSLRVETQAKQYGLTHTHLSSGADAAAVIAVLRTIGVGDA